MAAKKYHPKKKNKKGYSKTKETNSKLELPSFDMPIVLQEIFANTKTLENLKQEVLTPQTFYVSFFNLLDKKVKLLKIDKTHLSAFYSYQEFIDTLNTEYIAALFQYFQNNTRSLNLIWKSINPLHVISNYIINNKIFNLSFFGNVGFLQDKKLRSAIAHFIANESVSFENNFITQSEWIDGVCLAFHNDDTLEDQINHFITKPLIKNVFASYRGVINNEVEFYNLKKHLINTKTFDEFLNLWEVLKQTTKEPFFNSLQTQMLIKNIGIFSKQDWVKRLKGNPQLVLNPNVVKNSVPTFALLFLVIEKYWKILSQGYEPPENQQEKEASGAPPPQITLDAVNFVSVIEKLNLEKINIENVLDLNIPEIEEQIIKVFRLQLPHMKMGKTLRK